MEKFIESPKQQHFADYCAYLQLKRLGYGVSDILNHTGWSEGYMQMLIEDFE